MCSLKLFIFTLLTVYPITAYAAPLHPDSGWGFHCVRLHLNRSFVRSIAREGNDPLFRSPNHLAHSRRFATIKNEIE